MGSVSRANVINWSKQASATAICKPARSLGRLTLYTIAGLAAAIGMAVLLTPVLRSHLRTRYPWVAAGIALLIWAPNLAWQIAKGSPSLVYIANHQGSGGGLVGNLLLIVVYLFFLTYAHERATRSAPSRVGSRRRSHGVSPRRSVSKRASNGTIGGKSTYPSAG